MNDEQQQASQTWRVTPDMMCILDGQGRFVAVNPAWHQTLGWPREDMVGQRFLEFVHPDDVTRSSDAFGTLVDRAPLLGFENRYRTATHDEYRWLQWVAVPEGENYYATARDVTGDKQRIERIADQQAEAELREQFIAVLTHDLRNPIAAVGAGTRLLLKQHRDEKSVEILEQMQTSVARMSEMVRNLMDLARVRLGSGLGLKRAVTSDLPKQLEQVVEELRLASPDTRIETTMTIDGPVHCDVGRIGQLVSNLLANAISHGDAGHAVQLHAQTSEERLRIAISNRAPPMSQDTQEKLFQPFFRGDALASRQGLGLGLYIASEIARAHGGTLTVDSGDTSTRFTLDMPR